jgi:putative phosphoribosyl transferase
MARRSRWSSPTRFSDRRDAGRQLADVLADRQYDRPVILALPRGGVPVAAEVASRLHAPLDVLIVRKIGCPGHRELGIGAVAEGGVQIRNEPLIARLGVTDDEVRHIADSERAEVTRRARRYRGDRPAVPVRGRTAIVVDDGLATGFTARAAIDVLRARQPSQIALAVPVAPTSTIDQLRAEADEVVCLQTPASFVAIGQWYDDFHQVRDAEVAALLTRVDAEPADPHEAPRSRTHASDVRIPAGTTRLPGTMVVPPDPVGIVVFAHGSGSSRHSPRNAAVARTLQSGALATLLFDLLNEREAAERRNVFDIGLLADRLVAATAWVRDQAQLTDVPIGYFGASTGAAAALVAAARQPAAIGAIVSRGGRPDLAGSHLQAVTAPTLLIVGGRDTVVLRLNEQARAALGGTSQLEVVPGATHLFEDPGALERVAALATDWFTTHLQTDE